MASCDVPQCLIKECSSFNVKMQYSSNKTATSVLTVTSLSSLLASVVFKGRLQQLLLPSITVKKTLIGNSLLGSAINALDWNFSRWISDQV